VNELAAALYHELHRLAARHLRRERPEHTLQTTALVHEAFLKLAGEGEQQFVDTPHFLAVASRVMRQVLVDYARARASQKRNAGSAISVDSGEVDGELKFAPVELLDLDSALDALSAEDRNLAQLIEMRYFGGMTAEETARALGISPHIVRHDLRLAHAWLRRRLG